MVFQTPSLLPWRTVLGNVTFGLEIEGAPGRQAEARARHYVGLAGLHGFEDSYPSEISEGMRQRVNLARALATEPELLLLDEPFASLDALTRNHLQMELQAIWHQTGRTAVFVTHNISEAVFLGDFVVVLSSRPGRVKEIVHVDLPRPRSLHSKRTPEFNRIEERLWNLLEHEPAIPASAASDDPGATS
jgi:NitT/TauT family transport system ATP-binding protein